MRLPIDVQPKTIGRPDESLESMGTSVSMLTIWASASTVPDPLARLGRDRIAVQQSGPGRGN
jgi:hypothetical protein